MLEDFDFGEDLETDIKMRPHLRSHLFPLKDALLTDNSKNRLCDTIKYVSHNVHRLSSASDDGDNENMKHDLTASSAFKAIDTNTF